jgi:hypothetical protein
MDPNSQALDMENGLYVIALKVREWVELGKAFKLKAQLAFDSGTTI